MLTLDTWHEDGCRVDRQSWGQIVVNTFSTFLFVRKIGQIIKYLVQKSIPVSLILVFHANKHVFSSVPHTWHLLGSPLLTEGTFDHHIVI